MMQTKIQKRLWMVRERTSAMRYKKIEKTYACFGDTSFCGIGRYGFDMVSSFQSVAWFNTLDAPFSNAKQKLAESMVSIRELIDKVEEFVFIKLASMTLLDTIRGARRVNGLSSIR